MIMQTTIRYFTFDYDEDHYDEDLEDYDIIEVSEAEFLDFNGEIEYERHTVRENGVNQVCLTKGLPRG